MLDQNDAEYCKINKISRKGGIWRLLPEGKAIFEKEIKDDFAESREEATIFDENLEESSIKDTAKMNMSEANSNIRPKMTYAQLIAEVLLDAEDRKMRSSEICHAIAEKYPYYNLKDRVWQQCISYNLSAHKDKLFTLLDKDLKRKGGFWKLLPKGEEFHKSRK